MFPTNEQVNRSMAVAVMAQCGPASHAPAPMAPADRARRYWGEMWDERAGKNRVAVVRGIANPLARAIREMDSPEQIWTDMLPVIETIASVVTPKGDHRFLFWDLAAIHRKHGHCLSEVDTDQR